MKYTIQGNTVVFYGCAHWDPQSTFNCGQCFRWDEKDGCWLGFAEMYPCEIQKCGDELHVKLLHNNDNMQGFAEYMYHYLALDTDYEQLKNKFSTDAVMKKAVDYAPGIRVLNQPFFETLLTFIISRNNNIPRIKKIVDSMAVKYGTKVGDLYTFPTRQQLKDVTVEEYNELRMGFRSKYIFDAVQKILSGDVCEEELKAMDYPAAQKYLMQIKGVGPKVADCVLLFGCEKKEAFPKDVHINRALRQMFPNGLPECIQGNEGIAQQYIFQYARFNLEKE